MNRNKSSTRMRGSKSVSSRPAHHLKHFHYRDHLAKRVYEMLNRRFANDEERSLVQVIRVAESLLKEITTGEILKEISSYSGRKHLEPLGDGKFIFNEEKYEIRFTNDITRPDTLHLTIQKIKNKNRAFVKKLYKIMLEGVGSSKKILLMIANVFQTLKHLLADIIYTIYATGQRWLAAYIYKCPFRFEEILYDNSDFILDEA